MTPLAALDTWKKEQGISPLSALDLWKGEQGLEVSEPPPDPLAAAVDTLIAAPPEPPAVSSLKSSYDDYLFKEGGAHVPEIPPEPAARPVGFGAGVKRISVAPDKLTKTQKAGIAKMAEDRRAAGPTPSQYRQDLLGGLEPGSPLARPDVSLGRPIVAPEPIELPQFKEVPKLLGGIPLPGVGEFTEQIATNLPSAIMRTLQNYARVEEATGEVFQKFPKAGRGLSATSLGTPMAFARELSKVTTPIAGKVADWMDKKLHPPEGEESIFEAPPPPKGLERGFIRAVGEKPTRLLEPEFMGTYLGKLVGEQIPVMAAMIGGAAINPALGFVAAGGMEAGAYYDQALKEGADPKTAANAAMVVGAINGLLEYSPVGVLTGKFPALNRVKSQITKRVMSKITKLPVGRLANLVTTTATQAAFEGITEYMQEAVSTAARKVYDEEQGIWDAVWNIENAEAGIAGIFIGAGMAVGKGGIDVARERLGGGEQITEGVQPTPDEIAQEQSDLIAHLGTIRTDQEIADVRGRIDRLKPYVENVEEAQAISDAYDAALARVDEGLEAEKKPPVTKPAAEEPTFVTDFTDKAGKPWKTIRDDGTWLTMEDEAGATQEVKKDAVETLGFVPGAEVAAKPAEVDVEPWVRVVKREIEGPDKAVSVEGITKVLDRKTKYQWDTATTGKSFTAKVYHGTPDARFLPEFDPEKKGYYPDLPEALADSREFIELHGGIGKGFQPKSISGNIGVAFSDSREVAKSYADKPAFDRAHSIPMVVERYVTLDNPKVIDFGGKEWALNMNEEIEKAISEGHDGLVFKNIRDTYHPQEAKKPANNLIAFSTDNIKTKAQLTDIWNEAHRVAPEPPEVAPRPPERPISKPVVEEPTKAVKPEKREPWKMTREGWREDRPYREGLYDSGAARKEYIKFGGGSGTAQINNAIDMAHKLSVRQALSEGKPVPPEVLADYPDLRPAVEAPVVPAEKPIVPGALRDMKALRALYPGMTFKRVGRDVTVTQGITDAEAQEWASSPGSQVKNWRERLGNLNTFLQERGYETGKPLSVREWVKGQQAARRAELDRLVGAEVAEPEAKRKTPYFTLAKAKTLARTNFKTLSDAQLQKKIVLLRDYVKYIESPELYGNYLAEGGYYIQIGSQGASGVAPKDIFLFTNLKQSLTESLAEKKRRGVPEPPPVAAVPEKVGVKEPWEMTREEFATSQGKDTPYVQQQRDAIVKQAVKRGDPVPAEVLAEYPELTEKAEQPEKVREERVAKKPVAPIPATKASISVGDALQAPDGATLTVVAKKNNAATLEREDGTKVSMFYGGKAFKALVKVEKVPAKMTKTKMDRYIAAAEETTVPAKSVKIGDMFLHPAGEVYTVVKKADGKVYIQDGKKRVVPAEDDIHLMGALNDPILTGKSGGVVHFEGEEWTEGFEDIEGKPEVTEYLGVLDKLKTEEKGFIEGRKIGKTEMKKALYKRIKTRKTKVDDIRKQIIAYANEHLSKRDRYRIASIASKGKTKRSMSRALQAIDVIEDNYQRGIAVRDLKKTVKGIDFKRLRPEYKATIQTISDSYDLVNRRDKTIDQLEKMVEYIGSNPDHNIPERQMQRLAILAKIPQKNMTTDDITLVSNALKHFVKLNDLKNTIKVGHRVRDFTETRDEAVVKVEQKDPAEIDPREGIKASKIKKFLTTESLNAEHITRDILDRGDGEINTKVFYDGIDEGVSEVLRVRQDAIDFFNEKLHDMDIDSWSETFHPKKRYKRIKGVEYYDYTLASGEKLTLTKAERISLALHAENENSLRHILEGGLRLSTNPTVRYVITPEDIDAITASLTKEERRVGNAIYEYYNTVQKDRLNETSVRLNGWEIATEAAYFPIRVHGLDVHRNYLLKGEALPTNMRQFTQSTLEGMGSLKERVKAKNALVLEDAFAATYNSIKQASTYIGLAEPIRNVKALLYDPKFRTAVMKHHGPHMWNALRDYIGAIEGEYQGTEFTDQIVTAWINRLDIATLGMNPFVMMKQPVSLLLVATEVDSKFLLKALAAKPEKIEVMSQHSTQLRDRFEGNVTRELGEVGQVGQVRKFWTHKSTLGQVAMKGIRFGDYQAIGRIWKVAQYETEAYYPELSGQAKMQRIASRTEELTRLTQPTFHSKDRSAIGRSKSIFVRLLTKYTSQRNKIVMMIHRATAKYNRSDKKKGAKAKLMRDLGLLLVVAPALIYGIDELRDRLYKRKRRTKTPWQFKMAMKIMENNIGTVYFLGPAYRSLASKVERGGFAGYDISDVMTSWVETGIDAMANTIRAIDQAVSQEKYKSGDKKDELKWKSTAMRAANQAGSFALRYKGIPYNTLRAFGKGIYRHAGGGQTAKTLMEDMKWAVTFDNFGDFEKARSKYVLRGKTRKDFYRSISRKDEDEKTKFKKWWRDADSAEVDRKRALRAKKKKAARQQ